ncbi:MAG: methylisocitrate lyase [Gammaproteobacteria bacterium]|nr:methylisocitrate lyase [Gammaproteobacteria bacterium]
MRAGLKFRNAIPSQGALPVLGVINAYSAKLAEHAGALALYCSGAGVANACFGLPDLAMTSLKEVLEEAQRITSCTDLPLLVDIDTGFGSVLSIQRTIREMEKAGVAAIHIEDQPFHKRCGHRDGKRVVSQQTMVERIQASVDARQHQDFVIMARTDALAIESIENVIERVSSYVEAGADMIFMEAIRDFSDLERVSQVIDVPILVNSTEFGKTPIHTMDTWAQHGANLVLYPLSAFRAMSKAAFQVYSTILKTGTQSSLLEQMQTRQSLYDILDYERYEQALSALHGEE